MDKIYVKEINVPKTNTRKEFLKEFLMKKPATYSDANCREEQCRQGAYRSISELEIIVKTRFPGTSQFTILRIIKELIDERIGIVMVYCTIVEKAVVKYLGEASSNYVSEYSRDNFYTKKGIDGYSLKDYDKIINKIKK